MDSHSDGTPKRRFVVDNIHGDIELTELEWRVVNTASFQRLRSLKQLGMGHLVYPNATHTRFAHSIGVLGIMRRIVKKIKESKMRYRKKDLENLCLAALLHDIGHYPYSHLMERIDYVTLTEEEITDTQKHKAKFNIPKYPDHGTLGQHILLQQDDIKEVLGGEDRAKEIGAMFSRTEAAHPQLSKLIHSSLDMDRLDYLIRDARAAGVPYGEIDINYILNNIRISPKRVLGLKYKSLAAAEHFLLARLFMYRVVYYHKTIFGFEEACRQLLRRIRDQRKYEIPQDGKAVEEICSSKSKITSFTDDFVDRIIREAACDDSDLVIQTLAKCITSRRPPKLLVEVSGLQDKSDNDNPCAFFRSKCKEKIKSLADKYDIPLGLFLICAPKPIKIEERRPLLTRDEAMRLKLEEREELIKIFDKDSNEPKSIIDINNTIVKHLSGHLYGIQRLYLVDLSPNANKKISKIKSEVQKWIKPSNVNESQ